MQPDPQSSPFRLGGTDAQEKNTAQSQSQPLPSVERNRGRGFRHAGNACEIAAGASLNSAIVFLFHLMQVHPLGLVVALGVSHAYFTATAWGEDGDRRIANVMTGCSAGIAALCSLSEPIGEWWEARTSRSIAVHDLQSLYVAEKPSAPSSGWLLVVLAVLVLGVAAMGGKDK